MKNMKAQNQLLRNSKHYSCVQGGENQNCQNAFDKQLN